MKFSIAITAIVALLPIALAAPASVFLDDDASFNETSTHGNELEERYTRITKQSQLTIQVYKKEGCKGPLYENKNIRYDDKHAQPFRYKSYKLLQPLVMGESLKLMSDDYDNDVCARVTSHTDYTKPLAKGCYALGGDTGKFGSSQCFQLIRYTGFTYP
ncbi:MAG: hypothetical protein LQ346_008916, partial [Caloplaca aetnensis]